MKVTELREQAGLLGFTPADQVRWLSPTELVRTAIQVGLSSTLAGYFDRREVQAALPKPAIWVDVDQPDGPDDPGEELWLDFVSDLGDGFDATYTVACLLASARLEVATPDGARLTLPRGRVLVLGGDEVYPTPSAVAYEDRTRGPYRAALPKAATAGEPEHRRPLMLALPGNHDWYDGLTAFLRLFCQRRPIGGWRTAQTRSYFAVRLPNNWWLVGVDTQLGTYIDEPQIQYFREHLSAHLQPGDAVIICSPEPTWVKTSRHPDAFNSLHWFEQHVVGQYQQDDGSWRPTQASVRLWLSGDLHHYARYEEELTAEQQREARSSADADDADVVGGEPRQFFTCGLGGSFVTETHELPERLSVPPQQSRLTVRRRPARLRLQATYPDPAVTQRLAVRVLSLGPFGLPVRNHGFWRLSGAVQAVLLLVLAGVLGQQLGHGPIRALREAGLDDVVRLAWQSAVVLASVLLFFAVAALVRAKSTERRRRLDIAYEVVVATTLQLVVAFGALLAATAIPWPASLPSWAILALLGAATVAGVGLVASYAFALYLLVSRARLVRGWRMAAQAVEDYKGFLRLQFAPDGSSVRVHPVVVDTVHREWRLDGDRPVPDGDLPPARLVEAPIVVNRRGAGPVQVPVPDDDPRPSARARPPDAGDLTAPETPSGARQSGVDSGAGQDKVPQPPAAPPDVSTS